MTIAPSLSITRAIAAPGGDVPYAEALAAVPLEGEGAVTYGAYFAALEAFVARDDWAALRTALAASGREPGAVQELVVRAEKHGALYHPASLTVVGPDWSARYCVNVAVSALARACLAEEAGLLAALRRRFGGGFLPEPYAAGEADGFGMLLEEWFTGFHEFHQDGSGRVRLWDYDAGERLLLPGEALAVYREAARILTRYFDPATGAVIGPWHHAAGDFVARVVDGDVSVRCITVRGHGSGRDFSAAGPMAQRLAVLAFFTNLTLRVRLDRVDGVGALVLAGDEVAAAVVEGFVQAWRERPDTRDSAAGVFEFLASFTAEELCGAGRQLAEPATPEEAALLDAAWPRHAAAVVAALRRLLAD